MGNTRDTTPPELPSLLLWEMADRMPFQDGTWARIADHPDGHGAEFLAVDFHVHTPASSCYKGERTDSEYLEILRRYRNKGIRAIAVTDHNTIAGYLKIANIHNGLISRRSMLEDLVSRFPEVHSELAKVEADLGLFEELLVIPGVEFEATPGIHMLLIFDPSIELERIQSFLVDAGYTPDNQGEENPSSDCCRISVDQMLDRALELGAVVIAAHADRRKGAYKSLEGSLYRARVLGHPALKAISFCDPESETLLEDLMRQKDYRRDKPVALIKSSDYHGGEDVGKAITYLRLPTVSFEAIVRALDSPLEDVSPSATPDVRNRIERLANAPNVFCAPSASIDVLETAMTVCALVHGGIRCHAVIGVKRSKGLPSIRGVSEDAVPNVLAVLAEAAACLRPPVALDHTTIRYGDDVVVFASFIPRAKATLYHLDDDMAYVMERNKPRLATAPEIRSIVETGVLKEIEILEYQTRSHIGQLANAAEASSHHSSAYRINQAIQSAGSHRLRDLVAPEEIPDSDSMPETDCGPTGNYLADGTVVVLGPVGAPIRHGRLPLAYLRLTAPRTSATPLAVAGDIDRTGPALVAVPGGGIHYVPDLPSWRVLKAPTSGIFRVLRWRDGVTDESLSADLATLRLALWLKSSFAIWHVLAPRLRMPRLPSPDMPVPDFVLGADPLTLDELGERIISAERQFLEPPPELLGPDGLVDWGQQPDYLTEHNNRVNRIAFQVDCEIGELLGIDAEDRNTMYGRLRASGVFDLDPGTDSHTATVC